MGTISAVESRDSFVVGCTTILDRSRPIEDNLNLIENFLIRILVIFASSHDIWHTMTIKKKGD